MAIQDVIGGSIAEGAAKIISLFKVDPNVALQNQTEVFKITEETKAKVMDGVTQMSLAQNEVNKQEAASPKLFIAGWRPFIGWICGITLGFALMVGPTLTWVSGLMHRPDAQFPKLDTATLLEILLGMLGLGGMRTYEKVSGVTDTHIKD